MTTNALEEMEAFIKRSEKHLLDRHDNAEMNTGIPDVQIIQATTLLQILKFQQAILDTLTSIEQELQDRHEQD